MHYICKTCKEFKLGILAETLSEAGTFDILKKKKNGFDYSVPRQPEKKALS